MQKEREIIKNCYKFNFQRTPEESEVDLILNRSNSNTKSRIDTIKEANLSITKEAILNRKERMMVNSGLLVIEMLKSIELLGERYIKSTRFMELHSANMFSLAMKKLTGQDWDIYLPQKDEVPDIVLVERSDINRRGLSVNPIFLEILELRPLPPTTKYDSQTLDTFFHFIIEKKYINKSYDTGTSLIVNVGPTYQIMPLLVGLSNLLKKYPDKFSNIFITGSTGKGTENFVDRVYPVYSRVVVDPIIELQK